MLYVVVCKCSGGTYNAPCGNKYPLWALFTYFTLMLSSACSHSVDIYFRAVVLNHITLGTQAFLLLCPLLCCLGVDHVTQPLVMSFIMCSLSVSRDDVSPLPCEMLTCCRDTRRRQRTVVVHDPPGTSSHTDNTHTDKHTHPCSVLVVEMSPPLLHKDTSFILSFLLSCVLLSCTFHSLRK